MKALILIPVLAALSGCMVGPDYHTPPLNTALPEQYQQIDAGHLASRPVDAQWWLNYHDQVITQLVSQALQRNLDLASANASITLARAQLNIADSAGDPQLNADGRVGRDQFSKNSENFANIPFPNPKTNFSDYRIGFDASWEIDLFGHNRRSTEAAEARLNSIEFQRAAVELRVAGEVVRNIVDYRAWQQRSSNAQQIIDLDQQLLDLVVLQQKAGLLADSDVLDAQTNLHNATATLAPLQSAAMASLLAITVLTDQSQEQVSATLQSALSAQPKTTAIDAIGLPSDLLQRRPDIQSAERDLAAATADIGVAVAEQYPQVTLLANGGLDSITPGKLTNLASRYWDLGPQISIPILSGGRLAAQVKAREAARDAALAQYRQTVLAAFSDTETALIRYQREQQRLAQLRLAIHSQQQQIIYAQQHYQSGDTNAAGLLQARALLAQMNDAQLASQQALAENLVALYKALGGGTSQNKTIAAQEP